MIEAYRLHRSQYAASDGTGSAKAGARWNPRGVEVVYCSSSPSLAVLEILVNYDGLPPDFVLTRIVIPDRVSIIDVPASILVKGWDSPIETSATQEYGQAWIASGATAVLKVPSAIVPRDSNYVINVNHPDFRLILFGPSEPFRFDPRLG